ncbi:MAG: dUTP diphosphatase [Brevinematales bacterium]|nr:dUTP diphosphatase [Brevinematales bacterium]
MKVFVKKLHNNAIFPEYHSTGAAGADIYSCLEEDVVIKPGDIVLIPTGLAVEIPEGYEIQIRPRSGLATKGIILPNSPGTIDSDYRGEIKVILMNLGKEPFVIHNHDRIGQMVLSKYEKIEFEEVSQLSDSERGSGGFGSTGSGRKS